MLIMSTMDMGRGACAAARVNGAHATSAIAPSHLNALFIDTSGGNPRQRYLRGLLPEADSVRIYRRGRRDGTERSQRLFFPENPSNSLSATSPFISALSAVNDWIAAGAWRHQLVTRWPGGHQNSRSSSAPHPTLAAPPSWPRMAVLPI